MEILYSGDFDKVIKREQYQFPCAHNILNHKKTAYMHACTSIVT